MQRPSRLQQVRMASSGRHESMLQHCVVAVMGMP